ncbi:MAG: FGGY family carbohydrate kinase [Chloroflexi bacterium]|nr:FGGY family carbohydrate kinase [Chloroflexota bacterium]
MNSQEPLIAAIDAGTSSLKAVLYNQQGAVLASATKRYAYRSEQPGWAEADPRDWWLALESALGDLGKSQSLAHLNAIAFTGQMHTAVLLDEHGEPLEPAILWLDRRAAAETAVLASTLRLPPYQINSTYTLPKLMWLKANRPDVTAKIRSILWVKDYLRYRLTGVVCTDLTEAGGAALWDWDRNSWAIDRLRLAGLDPSVLPPIRPADDVVGSPEPRIAEKLGLNKDAKVIVGMGDVAALIGGAPPKPGRVVCSLGSSSMTFAALGEDQHPRDTQSRLYTYPFLPPYRLFGGVSSTTGAALVWAFGLVKDSAGGLTFEDAMKEALGVPPGAEGLCFIPYLAGERSPYWRDDIRAGFYGFQLSHERRHLVRAVMEGTAFSLRHLLDIYAECGVPARELALAGGGVKTPGLCQIIADVCGMDVAVYAEAETVTRVLFALCRSALDRTNFAVALAGTFREPERVQCNQTLTAQYQSTYETFRRFSDFALKNATHAID